MKQIHSKIIILMLSLSIFSLIGGCASKVENIEPLDSKENIEQSVTEQTMEESNTNSNEEVEIVETETSYSDEIIDFTNMESDEIISTMEDICFNPEKFQNEGTTFIVRGFLTPMEKVFEDDFSGIYTDEIVYDTYKDFQFIFQFINKDKTSNPYRNGLRIKTDHPENLSTEQIVILKMKIHRTMSADGNYYYYYDNVELLNTEEW